MTGYLSLGWAFSDKDLAIVSTNTTHIIEIEVPEGTYLIDGHFVIDEDEKGQCILVPLLTGDLDPTDVLDYTAYIEIDHSISWEEDNDDNEYKINVLDSFETKGLNFKIGDLSLKLQNQIRSRVCEIVEQYEIND